ncbi:MAG: amino acid permease [Candidatus Brocadia sp. AMX2]|uniref:PTS EIIA type-2 domain-containing protein n=1 Tax=Candidatus Brocadia sinica JPN1 TaxID=1197129 RepID=A0ABQ0JUZ4_9BACT|nr:MULTISPECIES: amino acid permease [Brocadia]MBC6930889.1 amino acid permease [Candidatus Brocadia sp.]MBL1167879.1 amino acid permease [Candidatus Brocadia sp. AMX1]MCK6469138.1 amino acid permease [Candidatus Brocadia sinica]KAA0245398.1 MAG: amino acid permease [Candidatus Brocadia sp. AMX2]MCE7865652.1 amino acid permease [Candidatus Brocadia sp. AMX2]
MEFKTALTRRLKTLIIGDARSPHDRTIFHKLSLIAFFAWVGLGADGLSSSCYGPEEAFRALQGHSYLSVFVALGSVLTIFVISASYSQIVELFPSGGGGYLVASKLLSPTLGMFSGCALIVDYVLTIAVSIASGTDAVFSFLPVEWHAYKQQFAIAGIMILTILNLRGVKEAVAPLVPIFLIFVITHAFVIVYVPVTHLTNVQEVVKTTMSDVHTVSSKIGLAGMFLLILRAYSMGAGTFTGIEAVSNGLPILREPRVRTAKRTMRYMAISLSVMVLGLMFSYLLYKVEPQSGKTLNAVLFEHVTGNWGDRSKTWFVIVTLVSEAMLLLVAAQAGFLDGPRVIANMALDRWFPTRFAVLSDRLVTKNGVLFMGIAALILMLVTRGSIQILIVRAKDKSSALKEMMEILLKARRISDPGTVLKTLWEHETIDTTGIGQGVAFPHASIEGLKEPVALLAISQRGVDFKAKDGHPVHLFFLFLTPVKETTLHLQILSRAAAIFTDKSLYYSLRKAKTPQAALSLLLHHEKGGKEVFFPHSIGEIYKELETSPSGLSEDEAKRRLERYGRNALKELKGKPLFLRFMENLYNLLAILLWVGGALAFVADMPELGWAIFAVILINAVFSFWQEYKAERALEALKKLLPRKATVLRDGKEREISAEELVPGDIIFLEEGDSISAG